MKKMVLAATAVAASPLLLVVPVIAISAGSAGANVAANCEDDTQDLDTRALAAQVESILSGGDGEGVEVARLRDPREQIPNARTILATGVAMNVPARGQVVALATAMQESTLRNIDYGDRDSVGLFQQRPSQGWGTVEQIMDPVHSSKKFYQGLLEVAGWESLTVTQAAQAVQRSAYPDAYAQWEPLARALQQAIVPTLDARGEGGEDDGEARSPAAEGCAREGDGSGYGPIPDGTLPAGYEIPEDAPAVVRSALRWAVGQLGTPYQWGGSCTAAHGSDPLGRCDCSSLMQQAYKAAGVRIGRTTYVQVEDGRAVALDALKPGDLVFTRGTKDRPEHVGMVIGHGLVINAPRTGTVVRVEPLADWKPQILAARRVV
ncbi:C40 family peptidase [Streptomyces sp. ST2-7A]|uniref:C40 family peptidase n=1 Tax=Streptomyces sp. ST2-7A TaxID=2907214 RepID=UPI001F171B25|nr:C40 family peptidase [Streptomyces sp. ST2-7A]MCE7080169.1 C40 family peptidase [Streptomyces sp. ST2-7A]